MDPKEEREYDSASKPIAYVETDKETPEDE